MMTPITAPANNTANGLYCPTSPASWEGRPKIPLPMMEFTTSATMLQRPMARTRAVEFASVTEMLVTDEEIVHKEKAAGAEIRSMLSSRLSCIVVYRMQAHPITRRVIPARGDDIAGGVSQQQRANGLLQRFAGAMLLLQSFHRDLLQSKFPVELVFEDANRLQLRNRLGPPSSTTWLPVSLPNPVATADSATSKAEM